MPICKIEIKDEVNCKLTGLELTERRALSNKFKYEIPGVKYQPSVRLGRWDGKVTFFQLGGSTYINLLSEIIPYLYERGYEVEVQDNRTYNTHFQFDQVTEDTFKHKVWPDKHPIAGQPVVLRDYQIEIINKFLENPQCIQEIATGAGKTLITATLSYSCEAHGKSIVIVPNKSLVTQTEADYRNLGLDVGVYYGDRKEFGHTHTICTWQSINILMKKSQECSEPATSRLLRDPTNVNIHDLLDGVVCIMVDECFSGEMKVLTVNGYIPIKDIKSGDKVINYAENNKEFKIDTVIKQHINLTNSTSEKMYELEFDNGSMIAVTGNHKFLTTDGWIRADELTSNHFIISKT